MLDAKDIAEWFLMRVDDTAGDSISNLKLQKLVYYAQGCHLALHGKPLFGQPIQAWEHGPVVPDLYHSFKQYGSGAIPKPDDFDLEKFDQETCNLLEEVFEVYGQFSAWKLRNMTHAEAPWRDAYSAGPSTTITHEALAEFFRTQLV